jgi:hypothetical protein
MTDDGPFIHIHSLEASKLGDGLEHGLSPAVLRSLSVRAIFLADQDDIVIVDQEVDPDWTRFLEGIGIKLPKIRVAESEGETLVEQITRDHVLCSELSKTGFPMKPYMGSVQNQTLAHQLGLRYLAPDNDLVDHLNHKSNLDPILEEIGLPRIQTSVSASVEILSDARSAFERNGPLMIRSDLSIGGHGVWRIEHLDDFRQLELGVRSASQGRKFIWQPLKAVTNSPNVQFEITDDSRILLGVSAQQMTEQFAFGGNGYPSRLSNNSDLLLQSHKAAEWLQMQGYRGLVGLDFIVTTEGEVFIVEINPRVNTSTFPLILSNKLNVQAFKLVTGIPMPGMHPSEIFELLGDSLLYNQHHQHGIIPLMIPTADRPVCDVMAFAHTLGEAETIVQQFNDRIGHPRNSECVS